MLLGNLTHSNRIEGVHPLFGQLFDYVRNTDFDALPKGRIDVNGDVLYIMNLDIDGADRERQPLEMHRRYIDVHILLGGDEAIGWKPVEEISEYTQPYEEEGDCALSAERPRFFAELHPGEFCIVYPEDAHAPAISDGRIRKLIGKARLQSNPDNH